MFKPRIKTLGIALLALTTGLSAFYVWRRLNPTLEPFDPSHIQELQTISYCDLRNTPNQYDGKIVRIDTNLFWFDHGYFLTDPACDAATDPKYLDSQRTALTFEDRRSVELLSFLRQYHSPERLFRPIRVTAVGRFTYRATAGYSDAIQDRTPYRFELYSIENVLPLEEPAE